MTVVCGSGQLAPAGERLLAATLDVAARESRAAVRAMRTAEHREYTLPGASAERA